MKHCRWSCDRSSQLSIKESTSEVHENGYTHLCWSGICVAKQRTVLYLQIICKTGALFYFVEEWKHLLYWTTPTTCKLPTKHILHIFLRSDSSQYTYQTANIRLSKGACAPFYELCSIPKIMKKNRGFSTYSLQVLCKILLHGHLR